VLTSQTLMDFLRKAHLAIASLPCRQDHLCVDVCSYYQRHLAGFTSVHDSVHDTLLQGSTCSV